MSVKVKSFLEREEKGEEEIRRFQIPADSATSFTALASMIRAVYPSLKDGAFSLFWEDSDGDLVSLSSDVELKECMSYTRRKVLKIFIRKTDDDETPSSEEESQPEVTCEGCDETKSVPANYSVMKMSPGERDSGLPGFLVFRCGLSGKPRRGFVPSRHFRRWLKGFMRRWHKRHASEYTAVPDNRGDKSTEAKGDNSAEEDNAGWEEDVADEEEETVEELKDSEDLAEDTDDTADTDEEENAEENVKDKPNETEGKGKGKRAGGRGKKGGHAQRQDPDLDWDTYWVLGIKCENRRGGKKRSKNKGQGKKGGDNGDSSSTPQADLASGETNDVTKVLETQ